MKVKKTKERCPTECYCTSRSTAPCLQDCCKTVIRWAAACRKAHWHEDDKLVSWGVYVNRCKRQRHDEYKMWLRVAIAALEALHNE